MGLWEKIRDFFTGFSAPKEKPEESCEQNAKGDLEVTVETVSAAEEDVSVEIFEMTEDEAAAPEEDPDIEVEIVDADSEAASGLAELCPAGGSEEAECSPESAELCRANAGSCGENTAECPSRMTDEYKQWLKEQEAQRNQQENSIE